MKVIDLFNDYSNGKELPEKIKYNGEIYFFNDGNYNTYNKYGYLERFFQWEWSFFEHLNDEVEIIEEDKKIEKLTIGDTLILVPTDEIGVKASYSDDYNTLANKINEIIDYIEEK